MSWTERYHKVVDLVDERLAIEKSIHEDTAIAQAAMYGLLSAKLACLAAEMKSDDEFERYCERLKEQNVEKALMG